MDVKQHFNNNDRIACIVLFRLGTCSCPTNSSPPSEGYVDIHFHSHCRCRCSWSLLCSAILHSRADSLHSCCVWLYVSECISLRHAYNIHPSAVWFESLETAAVWFESLETAAVWFESLETAAVWFESLETAAVSAHRVYTVQPCTISRHFMQSHIRRVHACLAVTCHLHLTGIWYFFIFFTCHCRNTGMERIMKTSSVSRCWVGLFVTWKRAFTVNICACFVMPAWLSMSVVFSLLSECDNVKHSEAPSAGAAQSTRKPGIYCRQRS